MIKCQQCEKAAKLFTLQDGKIVYACPKHASTVRHDGLVDWFRIGEVRWEG